MKRIFFIGILLWSVVQVQVADAQWLRNAINTDYIYSRAKSEYNQKNYTKSIAYCKKGLERSPDNLDFHYLLGRSYEILGHTDSARDEYKKVLDIDKKYKSAHIGLINIETGLCNYKEAINRADVALYYFPNDTTIRIKKIDLFNKFGNRVEADRISEELIHDYPTNRHLIDIYVYQHLGTAKYYARRGYLDKAKKSYATVLEQDPQNIEAIDASYTIDIKNGDYESSLININKALDKEPRSYELLKKKIGILEELGRYPEAIATAKLLAKYYPNDREAKELEAYLRMESARHSMAADPYSQFQTVVELEPGNREALNYVINLAVAKGYYNDALDYANKALKRYPNDPEFTAKKVGILENLGKYSLAAELQEQRVRREPNNSTLRSQYVSFLILSARQYTKDGMYDKAEEDLLKALSYDPDNYDAQLYLANLYIEQKKYEEALDIIDKGLAHTPGDEDLLFKKVAILQAFERYPEATAQSELLLGRHPTNEQYGNAFVETSLQTVKGYNEGYEYQKSDAILVKVLEYQPDNRLALHYMINVQSGMKQYDSALYYSDFALDQYPGDKEYLLKKSAILAELKRYPEAYEISGALYRNYPYNPNYKPAYIEQLLASGREYNKKEMPDSALAEYAKVLEVAPLDTNALFYTINTLNEQKRYEEAVTYINRGREAYPNIPYFLLKRAVIYENLQQWDSAYYSADTLVKSFPVDHKTKDYRDYLYSRTLRNDIGVFYLRSKYNYQSEPAHIATVQYLRYIKNSTLAFRANYVGRTNGVGFLYEAEAYVQHGEKWMSFINLGFSPDTAVWPRYRAAYSLFHNFKKGWQGELGGRYLQIDPFKIKTGVASIGKYTGDFFLNLRGYYSVFDDNRYASGVFTARYYWTDNKYDYVQGVAAYGITPDDKSIFYLFDQNYQYKTVNVGIGFQKHIRYRTLFGMFFNWYNQQMTETIYRNQHDVYIYIRRRF